MENHASHSLLNLTLKTGWYVKEKIPKNGKHTGSTFSVHMTFIGYLNQNGLLSSFGC